MLRPLLRAAGEDSVKVVAAAPRTKEAKAVSGELLRSLFGDKLDAREPEAA